MILKEWQSYCKAVYSDVDLSEVQKRECYQAFLGGCASVFNLLLNNLKRKTEDEIVDIIIDNLDELQQLTMRHLKENK